MGILPSQTVELAIYRYVKVIGTGRDGVQISSLAREAGTDTKTVIQRLRALHQSKKLRLSKYLASTNPTSDLGGGLNGEWAESAKPYQPIEYCESGSIFFSASDFFTVGDFVIEITPQGTPYFEKLELEEAEMAQAKSEETRLEDQREKFRRVWVVHGRDEGLRNSMFAYLRAIGLQPLEFAEARGQTGKPTPYVGEILKAAFAHAQAVVVLLTPDDEARLKPSLIRPDDPQFEKELTGQARPNVLFEAGMAWASHENRTVLVQVGYVRPFSDLAGAHAVLMDNSVAKRQELAQRLRDAGCPVQLNGTDWHNAGDLTPGQ